MSDVTIYESLPVSVATLWKRLSDYPKLQGYDGIELRNDAGHPTHFRMIRNGVEVGLVCYYRGRKLCFHAKAKPGDPPSLMTYSESPAPKAKS